MWCPGFAPLREGLDVDDDKDVIHYFQEVFKLLESQDSEGQPWLRYIQLHKARDLSVTWRGWWQDGRGQAVSGRKGYSIFKLLSDFCVLYK